MGNPDAGLVCKAPSAAHLEWEGRFNQHLHYLAGIGIMAFLFLKEMGGSSEAGYHKV